MIIMHEDMRGAHVRAGETLHATSLRRALSFYGISLLISIGAIVVFGWLADNVLEQEFVQANRAILVWFAGIHSEGLTSVARIATAAGSVLEVTVIVVFLVVGLILRKRHYDAITLVASVLGSVLLTQILKGVFQQIRPDVFVPLSIETSYSFPSGHTLTSFALWGFLAFWLVRENPRDIWRYSVALLFIAIATTVGISRMYLGVHWPTDVMAGATVAIFWVNACLLGEEWVLYRKRGRR